MISIRTATEDDAEELLAIYAPYVKQTAITFEYDVPSKKDFKSRISHTLEKYPYLVAEEDGKIVGYAYVSPFKENTACREISRMLSHLAISVVKCFISVVCAFSNITCTGK